MVPDDIIGISIMWPYSVLWVEYHNIYWDNFIYYWVLWISLGFYIGTTILATIVAHRLHFREYSLNVVMGPKSAFWGCLFAWAYCFPMFLFNWDRVSKNKAPCRVYGVNEKKGGCRSLAIIVSWALSGTCLALVAIPSYATSKVRSNEAKTITALREYASAQVEFRNRQSAEGNPRYCASFPNLYYGMDDQGKRLALVSKCFADAFVGSDASKKRMKIREGMLRGCNGYIYFEDAFVTKNDLWDSRFGLVAYPELVDRSGTMLLWVGAEGTILFREDSDDHMDFLSEEESPLHPEGVRLWQSF